MILAWYKHSARTQKSVKLFWEIQLMFRGAHKYIWINGYPSAWYTFSLSLIKMAYTSSLVPCKNKTLNIYYGGGRVVTNRNFDNAAIGFFSEDFETLQVLTLSHSYYSQISVPFLKFTMIVCKCLFLLYMCYELSICISNSFLVKSKNKNKQQ